MARGSESSTDFTPNNQAALDVRDLDLASSGVLILPDGRTAR